MMMPRPNDDALPAIEPVLDDPMLRPMAQSAVQSTAPVTAPSTARPAAAQPTAQAVAQPPRQESAQQQQRYVPVLSEVIGLSATSTAAANGVAAVTTPESSEEDPAAQEKRVHAAVQAVLRGLGPEFDQRLAEAMSRVLHEQLQGLHAKVRQAVAREVRAAVVAALTDDPANDGGGTLGR